MKPGTGSQKSDDLGHLFRKSEKRPNNTALRVKYCFGLENRIYIRLRPCIFGVILNNLPGGFRYVLKCLTKIFQRKN